MKDKNLFIYAKKSRIWGKGYLISLQQDAELNGKYNDDEYDLSEEDDEEGTSVSDLDISNSNSNVRGPRIAVSAEAYGKYNNASNFTPIVIPKSDEQITNIKARILQSFLFESLDPNDVKIIIDAMKEIKHKKGETVISQGDQGNCLYVVESGELDCYKKFVSYSYLIL